jgi:hypothetical protein
VTPLAFFEALQLGESMWFSTSGNSLWPLVLSGDEIEVQKIPERELRVGDLALVQFANGSLVAHLVVHINPLITSSSVGVFDTNVKGLGRVTKVKKFGRVVALPNWFHAVGAHIPKGATLAKQIPLMRTLVKWIRRP